ncbi:FAD-dependent oxidoreductase [Permianibacter aggregans]|uniref:Pyridine nucleotide-disulfide oxidoreductase n=1 Tax=Permianibacter aggregans TaxID=1510150 RepID=A0A4V3D7X4_9GAMM|nr:FAD-dependent oxidoreductase [Permianibacter aggregans]QGX40384.1 flavoprotein [Permianibacter aggregans]TDQ49487.1 pyridine nucleotide-disulfide oxidoreductase [Permianibacter aggregans]
MNHSVKDLPVAVIGAGPVGLAAAAHLLARGFTPLILEAGQAVASNLESYRHVRLFSPWRYNMDRAALRLLGQTDWQTPDLEALPTAGEMVDHYLKPLAEHPAIAAHLHFGERVSAITRYGIDKVKTRDRQLAPFVVRTRNAEGETEWLAQAVIDASGTWNQPNPLGANGLPALGEQQFAARIRYGMPDILGAERERYLDRHVLVVGSGHSAAGSLLSLAELAAQGSGVKISWAIRGDNLTRVFGGGERDGLPARGQLGLRLRALRENGQLALHTHFRVQAIEADGEQMTVLALGNFEGEGEGVRRIEKVDQIIVATGGRPNLALTRELRLRLDPWLESSEQLAPLIDPNEHSCGTVRPHGHAELAHPEAGYYAVGARSYGRAPNFLLATGYEQVRSVAAALAGDIADADDVQLELPETGVCSVSFAEPTETTACCETAAKVGNNACCGTVSSEARQSCCPDPALAIKARSAAVSAAPVRSSSCKTGCGV